MTFLYLRFLLSLLFAPMLALVPAATPSGSTHTVCPSGPPTCDHATLQAAIAVAGAGDTIEVEPGDYAGPVALKAGIRVASTGGAAVTMIYADSGPIITYSAPNLSGAAELAGFTVRLTRPAASAIGVLVYGGTLTLSDSVIRDVVGEPGDASHPNGYAATGVLGVGTAHLVMTGGSIEEIHGGDGAEGAGARGGDGAGVWANGDVRVTIEDTGIRQVTGGAAGKSSDWPYGCRGSGADAAGVRATGSGEVRITGGEIGQIFGGAPCRPAALSCSSYGGAASGVLASSVNLGLDHSTIHDVAVEPSHYGNSAAGLTLTDGASAEVTNSVIRDITGDPPWGVLADGRETTNAEPDSPCCPMPPGSATGIMAEEARSLTLKNSVIEAITGANMTGRAIGVSIGGPCAAVIAYNRIMGITGGSRFHDQQDPTGAVDRITAAGIWEDGVGNVSLAANTLRAISGGDGRPWCYGFPADGGSATGIYLGNASANNVYLAAQNNMVSDITGGDGDTASFASGPADGGDASAILISGNRSLYHNTLFHATAGAPGPAGGSEGVSAGVRVLQGGEVWGHSNALVGHEVGLLVETIGVKPLTYTGLWDNGQDYQGIGPGDGDLYANSAFRNPNSGDLHLTRRSAFVDAGFPGSQVKEDIDNNARPLDGNEDGVSLPDIGADERIPGSDSVLYLPAVHR